jgi:hypothetical protein
MVYLQKLKDVLDEKENIHTGANYLNKVYALEDGSMEIDQLLKSYHDYEDTIEAHKQNEKMYLRQIEANRQAMRLAEKNKNTLHEIICDRIDESSPDKTVRGHTWEAFLRISSRPSLKFKLKILNQTIATAYYQLVKRSYEWNSGAIIKAINDSNDFNHNQACEIAEITFEKELRVRNLKEIETAYYNHLENIENDEAPF